MFLPNFVLMKKIAFKNEFWPILAGFTILRLIAVFAMGLMPQDAYYTYYSDNLDLSYFDHPPMIAYMIKLFITLFGKSVVTLHIADFIITSFTLWFLYLFIKPFLSSQQTTRALTLLITAPFVTVLSINSTPDVPLLFFWSLSLLIGYKAVNTDKWYYWIFTGLLSGFAFDSKYTGIFLPAGMFLFLLLSNEHRKKLISFSFAGYLLAFAAAISPVVIWNIQNNFISFEYQSAQRATEMTTFQFRPKLFAGYLGSQLFLALPVFLFSIFIAGYKLVISWFKKEKIEHYLLYSACFALPMLFLFTGISFIYWVKINWIMPVYLSATVLTVLYLKSDKLIRWQTLLSVVFHIAIAVELIWMPVKVNSDDTWWGWEKLVQKVEEVKHKSPDSFIFSDNSYKVSAVLNFYMDEHIYAGNVVEKSAFQFALDDENLKHLTGKDAIYVTTDRFRRKRAAEGTVEQILAPYFSSVTIKDSLILKNRAGEEQRRFYFYDCQDYRAK